MKDQRAHSRLSTQITATVEVQSAPDQDVLQGTLLNCLTKDISLTGMCLYNEVQLPVETKLLLTMELGTPRKSFNMLGKVIWSGIDNEGGNGYMIGVHLVQLPGDIAAWQNAVLQTLVG